MKNFKIEFKLPKHGWCTMLITAIKQNTKTVKIDLSATFDPFKDFEKFLKNIKKRKLPQIIEIDEEGYGVVFTVRKVNESLINFEIHSWPEIFHHQSLEIELNRNEFIEESKNSILKLLTLNMSDDNWYKESPLFTINWGKI